MVSVPVDVRSPAFEDEEEDEEPLRDFELADLVFFAPLCVATHLPLLSTVPCPHSSVQTRPSRPVSASSAAVVGSSELTGTLLTRANFARPALVFSPQSPSTAPE